MQKQRSAAQAAERSFCILSLKRITADDIIYVCTEIKKKIMFRS